MIKVWDDLPAFAAALPPDRPLAGLDLGDRTIGVAVSDVRRSIASPLETLPRARKFGADAAALKAIADHRAVAGFIMGWPRNMDGSEGPRAQASPSPATSPARSACRSPSGTSGSRPSPPSVRSSRRIRPESVAPR